MHVVGKHLYAPAIFLADKVAAATRNPADVYKRMRSSSAATTAACSSCSTSPTSSVTSGSGSSPPSASNNVAELHYGHTGRILWSCYIGRECHILRIRFLRTCMMEPNTTELGEEDY